ncbi:phage holin, lambda family [Xenorhabdus griffiniae]|uniref:phage holin, lambda family n=1 Tax=Xenorhabdus griffiniae TaxID=351672 RepID=UPI002359DF71|nr:phage holin, lambda family [Xenorhabdus griffiniae]MDC9604941.1 phage holin, lambda family [Xenorhabdus griffiniae]
MKLTEKNTEFWTQLWNWILSNSPFLSGVFLAALTAFTREKRDGSGWRVSLAEAFICAAMSVGIINALEWANLPLSLAQFFGVLIGFLGTKKIGAVAETVFVFFKNKFGVNR